LPIPVTRHGMGVARHPLACELVSASKRRGGPESSCLNHYSGGAVRSAVTRPRFAVARHSSHRLNWISIQILLERDCNGRWVLPLARI
jgi:hypothetical protein